MDPTFIACIAIALVAVGYEAWNQGWLSGWKLPALGGDKAVSDQQAIEAARTLAKWYRQHDNGARALDFVEIAKDIFGDTV